MAHVCVAGCVGLWGRYFHDAAAQALYYTFNGTERPSGEERLALTTTKVLLNVSGSMEAPVTNVAIQGVVFRDAALTYLGTTARGGGGVGGGRGACCLSASCLAACLPACLPWA